MIDNSVVDFIGKSNFHWFTGVVEDNIDPLTLGRVKVRCHGIHPSSRTDVPTKDLPWATVLQPPISASNSGIGWSPNGLEQGTWVMGFFADGRSAQYPIIIGSIPVIHRANPPGDVGSSYSGYYNQHHIQSGEAGGRQQPYHGTDPEIPAGTSPDSAKWLSQQRKMPNRTGGKGAVIRDDGSYLTKADIPNWPLEFYTHRPSRGDAGLAAKDGNESLRIHLATALALEQLTRDVGRGPFGITSAYRPRAYNARVGGASNSQHIHGRAFDITLGSIGDVLTFAKLAVKNGFVGFGLYNTFIHIDTGGGRVWGQARNKDFQDAIRSAGWYPGKPGLEGVRVSHGEGDDDLETRRTGVDTHSDMAEFIRNDLEERGLTDVQIAGVMGTLQQESGLDPTAVNPSSGAFGLAQWLGPRRTALNSFASSRGTSPSNAQTQMDFMFHEFNTTERTAFRQLQSATTVEQSVNAMNRFERFAGWQQGRRGREAGRRYEFAEDFYEGWGGNPDRMVGFHDPTNSLPYREYRGSPSTHHAARGFNAQGIDNVSAKSDGQRVGSFPIAGEKGTFGDPEESYNAQYPHNHVYSTKSGHILEMDDTPNSERVHLKHKSVTRILINPKGTRVDDVRGRLYTIVTDDHYHGVLGNYHMTAQDDVNIRGTDMVIHADDSFQILVMNDRTENISGKYDILVGEVLQVKANKIILEADEIDVYSKGDLNFQAEEDINIKGKNINIQSDEETNIKSQNINIQSDEETNIKSQNTKIEAEQRMDLRSGIMRTTALTEHEMWCEELNITGNTRYELKHNSGAILADPSIEEAGVPEAQQAEEAGEATESEEADSTDLGRPLGRTQVQKSLKMKDNPDSHPTSEDGSRYYGDADA